VINNKIQKTKDRLLITQNAHNQEQMAKDAQIKLAFHENKGSFFLFLFLISIFKGNVFQSARKGQNQTKTGMQIEAMKLQQTSSQISTTTHS